MSCTKSGSIETCRPHHELTSAHSVHTKRAICKKEMCEQEEKTGRLKGTNVHSCKQNLIGAPQPGGQHKAARLYLVIVPVTYTLTL